MLSVRCTLDFMTPEADGDDGIENKFENLFRHPTRLETSWKVYLAATLSEECRKLCLKQKGVQSA